MISGVWDLSDRFVEPAQPLHSTELSSVALRQADVGGREVRRGRRGQLEAGGAAMEYEDRRGQMLRILPKDLRRDAFRRISEFKTVGDFNEWIREQLEYEKEGINWQQVHFGLSSPLVTAEHGTKAG